MSRVFIGVGHGGKDEGAVANGLKEKDINLNIALAMQAELVRHGVTVGMSRSKDEDDPASEVVREANLFKPDVCIDIHTNAGGGNGFEVFHQTDIYNKPDSIRYAKHIEKEVIKLGQNSRGLKTRLLNTGKDYFAVCRNIKAPTVLTECAFIDNKDDIQIVDELIEQKSFGVAYAHATLNYLGIPIKTSGEVLYGVMAQTIALRDKAKAEQIAKELNSAGNTDLYYKVIEIER